jgi:hypothetical protein
MTVAKELSKTEVRFNGDIRDQMGQRWYRTSRRIYIFYGKGNLNLEVVSGIFVHKRILSAVKRVEIVNDKLYIIVRGRWCGMVLNIHDPTEDKIDDMKDGFYEELERVFDK